MSPEPSSGVPILRHDLPDLEYWVGKRVGFGTPRRKLFKTELRNPTQPLSSWIVWKSDGDTIDVGSNQIVAGSNTEGSKVIREVFGYKAFNYAKPVSLIRELVRQSTGVGDLVLDFFAGSATTAQAVMELNAEDGMDRRFIMVSSTEATKDDLTKNLCRDVTAERIRRLNASTDPKYEGLAAGFAYLRTKEIKFEDLDYDLTPADAWTALEALHGLPLTLHDPSRVNFHAKLTRDLHRELTHQRVMFRRSGWGQGMCDLLLFPGCCGGAGLEAEAVVSGLQGEPLSAIDGVDGSCSRRRDAPLWGCRLTPSQGAIHGRDYHNRP